MHACPEQMERHGVMCPSILQGLKKEMCPCTELTDWFPMGFDSFFGRWTDHTCGTTCYVLKRVCERWNLPAILHYYY